MPEDKAPEVQEEMSEEFLLALFDSSAVEIDWSIADEIAPDILAEIDRIERETAKMVRWNSGIKTFRYRDESVIEILLAYLRGKPVDREKLSAMNRKRVKCIKEGAAISYFIEISPEIIERQRQNAAQIKRTIKSIRLEKGRVIRLGFKFDSLADMTLTINALAAYGILHENAV